MVAATPVHVLGNRQTHTPQACCAAVDNCSWRLACVLPSVSLSDHSVLPLLYVGWVFLACHPQALLQVWGWRSPMMVQQAVT